MATFCAAQENTSDKTQDMKKGRCLSRVCVERDRRGEMERRRTTSGPKEKDSHLRKTKRAVHGIRRRRDETARSLRRCDGALVLSWSSRHVRCGHGWTTGALHERSLFFFFTASKGNADVHAHYIQTTQCQCKAP